MTARPDRDQIRSATDAIRSAACGDKPQYPIVCRLALAHPGRHRDGGVSWVRGSDGAVVWIEAPEDEVTP